MLDFLKLGLQISQLGADSLSAGDETIGAHKLSEALIAFAAQCQDDSAFSFKLSANAPWVLWPTARPLEPLSTVQNITAIEAAVTPWTVLGVDGSQIMPTHHEVHVCYLLNCGLTRIAYGHPLPTAFISEPVLYAGRDDLYPLVDRRRTYIDENYVALERSLLELEKLAEAAAEVRKESAAQPLLALYDGSLIPWAVEKMSDGYIDLYLERFERALGRLRDLKAALVGYVSRSRAADTINALRSSICPFAVADCRSHCGHLDEEFFPCSKIWPLSDRTMFDTILQSRQRSATFSSGAPILKSLSPENAIAFCYLKNDTEVARLEFPRYLFEDGELFDFALRAVLSQCIKGQGYPLALAEAHHLAVVKGPDRERFFELLAKQLVSLGVSRVQVSQKERRKRSSFI